MLWLGIESCVYIKNGFSKRRAYCSSSLFLVLLLLLSISTNTKADIYRYRDQNGTWHFSAVPLEGYQLYMHSTNFVTVKLPKGVSIQIPKNWVVLSANQRINLNTFVESGLDLSRHGPQISELAFAANYYDDNGNTIGILNIRYYPKLDLSQEDGRRATNKDVIDLDTVLKAKLTEEMKSVGMPITSWIGTHKTEINGITAFVTEYCRASMKKTGDFRVKLVRVLARERSFTLTVSHLDSMSNILQPITDQIIEYLSLSGYRSK